MDFRSKRIKLGDVLLVSTPAGLAYLQYLGCHHEYGDAVLVSKKFDEVSLKISETTFLGSYVAFYPARLAVSRGLIEKVGHMATPKLPQRLRRPGARSGAEIITWIIEDGTDEIVTSQLSDEELKLPIASIWNHEFLTQRIAQGWSPMEIGGKTSYERPVIARLAAVSAVNPQHTILHYLYFPGSQDAAAVAGVLRNRGYTTEERLGADGVNWLVLARHVAIPTEELLLMTRQFMESLVAKVGGEYDGWEVEVRPPGGGSLTPS